MAILPKVRSALCAASQLPGVGPTDVEDALLFEWPFKTGFTVLC